MSRRNDMSAREERPTPTRRRLAVLVVVALTAVLAAALITESAKPGTGEPGRSQVGTAAQSSSSESAHTTPTNQRTVVVYDGREPTASTPGTTLRTLRVSGTAPRRPVLATVLSDENCTPDAGGVSHCSNALMLPDGKRLTVRHPHRMMDVACMTPGERVRVTRAA